VIDLEQAVPSTPRVWMVAAAALMAIKATTAPLRRVVYTRMCYSPSDSTFHRLTTSRRYAGAVYAVVVCLYVRPSVTRRYCTKTSKRRIMQTTAYSTFLAPKISAKFKRGHAQRGVK